MNARAEKNTRPEASNAQVLLDAAAGLLDKRIVAIQGGAPSLHALLELQSAASAIRKLAFELNRIRDSRGIGGAAANDRYLAASGRLLGPPVLTRVARTAVPASGSPAGSSAH